MKNTKIPWGTNYIYKQRSGKEVIMAVDCVGDGVFFVVDEDGALIDGISGTNNYDSYGIDNMDDNEFDIIAYRKFDSQVSAIRQLLYGECTPWDWERGEDPEEMTLEEICEELGRNIKIVKKGE